MTAVPTVETEVPRLATGFRVVQRTIMRPDQEMDVRSLYIGGLADIAGGDSGARQAGQEHNEDAPAADDASGSVREMSGFGRVSESGAAIVEPERRVTFATYFNAFPASYWRRWTDFDTVRLVVRARGHGTVIVVRSTSKGHSVRAAACQVDSEESQTYVLELPLAPFIDGGWYWFDLEGGQSELVLEEAVWGFETDNTASSRITIGITTFNRPDFCVAQLVNLGSDLGVLDILDEIIVVDQGSQKVVDNPGYADASARLGAKLRVIDQSNLGGSGGFSRAMDETVSLGLSDYVLLLDDDVVCELEGILRAVAFADLAKTPMLVGGQMFSLYDRTVMHAYGEALAPYKWFWGPAPGTVHGHNFARRSLRATPWLHRRVDVDYNGWWMCLIPVPVIREIGLSLPMFIKWDDAEFGLRAREAGYPTVTLPGVAVWHVPWTEKDDTLDWQAYFHERNRLISGLLHSPYDRGGRLVQESLENHLKRAMAMQYSTGELILLALQDVLDGPDRMHRDMTYRLGEIRALRQDYDDGRSEPALDAFPPPRLKKAPRRGKGVPVPATRAGAVRMAAVGLVRQLTPVRRLSRTYPESVVPHVDQRWFRLAHFDSAVVSSADGVTASLYRREPARFREQMSRSLRLHARLYSEWPRLAESYREALPDLASRSAWKRTFEGAVER